MKEILKIWICTKKNDKSVFNHLVVEEVAEMYNNRGGETGLVLVYITEGSLLQIGHQLQRALPVGGMITRKENGVLPKTWHFTGK